MLRLLVYKKETSVVAMVISGESGWGAGQGSDHVKEMVCIMNL